jgi:hypothetical protein
VFLSTSRILGRPQVPVQITQADWKKFLGQDSSAPSVVLPHPGMTLTAFDPIYGESEFVLAYGVASLAVGDAVRIGDGYATTRTVAGIRGRIGISMSANTDTAALSWFCVRGLVPANVAAATAANTPLFVTATPGSLDDAVVAGDNVAGATAATAQGATIDTKTIGTTNGSNIITVADLDGLYVGMAITGTGIPGSTTISAIGMGGLMLGSQGPQARTVQLSANATATGSVTGTFAHPATKVTAMLSYPTCTGAI